MDFEQPKRIKKPRRFPWWTLPVIALCVCLLWYAYAFASDKLSAYDKFNEMRALVTGDVFYGPVSLDGVTLTGMTMAEAQQALLIPQQDRAASFGVTLTHSGAEWKISAQDVPVSWNTQDQLDKLYIIGKMGTLEQRYREVRDMAPQSLSSAFVYDQSAVRRIIDGIAQQLTYSAVNASVTAFDIAKRTFSFSDETPGQRVNADTLYDTVISHLDAGQYGSVLPVDVVATYADVTRAYLEANYRQLSTYTTKTTDDKNRNTNIDLAAQAINGTMIDAGGEFSFNQTTGQRTKEKGYKEAGAIENGRTIQETGGGVCQVSSTAFNALVRANCEIVKRKPHAWPSDYVPRGEDATVDWPSLDVVLRNASTAPMFVVAYYADRRLTVEVYGLSLGDGVSIDLESVTTYTNKPTEVVYTYNASLPVGKTEQVKKARTGYSVQTYKIWLKDGVETSREKFYTSEYRMINEEYEYNDGKGPPPTTAP